MKRKIMFALLCAAVVMGGCGKKSNTDTDAAPTPSETPTPTVTVEEGSEEVLQPEPITVVYKDVGEQTENSVELIMENRMSVDIQELYVRESSESNWGENLMRGDTVIETGDTARIYIEETEEGSSYDIRMICSEDKIEILEEVNPSEIEESQVFLLEEEDLPYLVYVSAETGESVDTMEEVLERHGLGSSSSARDDEEDEPSSTSTPTPEPTRRPTATPTRTPDPDPTEEPDPEPTQTPDPEPTEEPDPEPTQTPDPGDDSGEDAPPPDDDAE